MVVMTTRGRAVVLVVALALAGSLLTLAVVLAKPAQAQAQTFTNTDRIPISSDGGSCFPDHEPVFVEGTLHLVTQTTIDANGVNHTMFHEKVQLQGEGLDSGDKYVAINVINVHQSYTLPPGETFDFTQTENTKLIRQGSVSATDDLHSKVLFHFTVNANGEVTAAVVKFELVCT